MATEHAQKWTQDGLYCTMGEHLLSLSVETLFVLLNLFVPRIKVLGISFHTEWFLSVFFQKHLRFLIFCEKAIFVSQRLLHKTYDKSVIYLWIVMILDSTDRYWKPLTRYIYFKAICWTFIFIQVNYLFSLVTFSLSLVEWKHDVKYIQDHVALSQIKIQNLFVVENSSLDDIIHICVIFFVVLYVFSAVLVFLFTMQNGYGVVLPAASSCVDSNKGKGHVV